MSSFSNKFSGYTMTQLNEILEDDEKLTKMVQEMDEVSKEVQQNKEKTLVNNRTLAEQNLALQPSLEHKKEDLTKHYRCLQERFESFQLRKSTLGCSLIDYRTLLPIIAAVGSQIKIQQLTFICNMADSFMDGEITLDSFVDSYQSKRKLAHLRRVKIEKLQEMVEKGHGLPQMSILSSRSQDVSQGPALLTENDSSTPSPVAQPRRKPPPPPSVPAPILSPAPSVAPQSPAFYSPYPPIPPRTGQPFPNIPTGYPNHYVSQYPPALPQRSAPGMAPQPGFIMQ
uniref:VPS37B subunit of ESCRT-I n=1 Tax=Oryzias sinensis TaxID=183150 RepID=A0A8C7XS38_9TELE